MRAVWIISPIIAIGLTTSAPAQGVDQNTKQQIEQGIAAYHNAWNKQDAAGIAAVYTSDGVFVGSDVKAVSNGGKKSSTIIKMYSNAGSSIMTRRQSTNSFRWETMWS
jgi:ketosteroid isomerase-like protein